MAFKKVCSAAEEEVSCYHRNSVTLITPRLHLSDTLYCFYLNAATSANHLYLGVCDTLFNPSSIRETYVSVYHVSLPCSFSK